MILKAKPIVIGKLDDGTEIVEIICPVCGSDRNEDLEDSYECCRCGQQFIQDYKEAFNEGEIV